MSRRTRDVLTIYALCFIAGTVIAIPTAVLVDLPVSPFVVVAFWIVLYAGRRLERFSVLSKVGYYEARKERAS